MSWNDKVFDNLEQVYWSPGKIGLRKAHGNVTPTGDGYTVPRALLDGGRSLYSRKTSHSEWRSNVVKDEELLNHVLEIGFAIAPSAFLAKAFFHPLKIVPADRITTIGREAVTRHRELSPSQFTQHDGFYIASNSIVMMEMKLKSGTSIEQYLKYCTLIALEEILYGERDELGLLYLVPQSSIRRTKAKLLLNDPQELQRIWSAPEQATNKSRLLRLLRNHPDAIRSVGERLKVAVIGWQQLVDVLNEFSDLAMKQENETLENLMQGMIAQIRATPDCEVE